MHTRVALSLLTWSWLLHVTPVELWREAPFPGESPAEYTARLDARADIRAELLAEAVEGWAA